MPDVAEGFHYIVAQNTGDNTNPELFLRLRGQKGRVIFECGVWRNPNNYEVGVDLDADQIGKELFIVGMYDKTVKSWILMINGAVVATAPNDNGPVAINANWMIAKHDFPGKERYFIGEIYFAAVYDKALSVMLLADEDNNGYIHSPLLNPERAVLEYGMSNEKRLTYFNTNRCTIDDVPDDYRRASLRTVYSFSSDMKYRFVIGGAAASTVTVKQKNNQQTAPNSWTNVNDVATPLLKATYDSSTKLFSDTYFVETLTEEDLPTGTATVTLQIGKQNGSVIDVVASDSVPFVIQEAPTNANGQYDWIVPSRWKIGSDGSLTTIETATGAVGPQSEGSGYVGAANKSGCVFSTATYSGGFTMKFKYSFTRNGVAGYVQPDMNGNETIDDNERKKISFVGNSGIKLGSFKGTSDGVTEIAIFDTKAMVDRVSVTNPQGTVTNGISAFHHVSYQGATPNFNYTGVPQVLNEKVVFLDNMIAPNDVNNNFEEPARLLNGIVYNQTLNNNVYDYNNTPDSDIETKLYNTMLNNYNNCNQSANEIAIYWKPDTGTLEVYFKIGQPK
jgi:hypothetical protein